MIQFLFARSLYVPKEEQLDNVATHPLVRSLTIIIETVKTVDTSMGKSTSMVSTYIT